MNVETGTDSVRIGFDAFLTYCFEGSHQSLEALFSPYKQWGPSEHAIIWQDYLGGLKITGRGVFTKYERTVRKFCFGDFKRRRHAIRLANNLSALRYEGRFNPVMSPALIAWANDKAENLKGEDLWELLV